MKRVCMVTHSIYAPDPRVRREAEALVEAGYTVDVIALRKPGGESHQVINSVQVYNLPVTRHQGSGLIVYLLEYLTFGLLAFLMLSHRHLRHRYAVIQVHTPPDFLVFVTFLPRLLGTPVLLDLHEIVPELFQERFGLAADHSLIRVLVLAERLACAYASAILAVHERHKDILVGRGIDPAKITSIPNCPDEGLFQLRQTNGHGKDSFTILYHGAVVPRYGLDILVQAMVHLRDHCPNARLRILGDGDAWAATRSLASSLELNDIVDMPGRVPITEIPASIAAADVGVVPNHRNIYTDEILPTKLLEFMIMERPTVVARTRLVESLFGSDNSMLFFEPGDPSDLAEQLAKLYNNPANREQLVKNAKFSLTPFRWSVIKQHYLEVVSRLHENSQI